MRLVAARSDAAATNDSEDEPVTPRGMAAPPAPRGAARPEADLSRPATIRIEAGARVASLARHRDLEHELDRAQAAAARKQSPLRSHLHLLLLSQGLLLNAFVILLVFGWNSPVPGWRLLLGGLALAGAVLAGWVGVVLRSGRGAMQAPRAARNEFGLGLLAAQALPASFVVGWIALSFYALALRPSAKASEEARQVPATAEPAATKETVPTPAAKRPAFKS